MLKGIHLGRQPLPSIEPDDYRILQLLRRKQYEEAFAALRTAYKCKLHQLCVILLRDRALAEDVLQESLLRIYQALDRYDGRASLYTWMYAITRNQCCSALARRRRDPLCLAQADRESTQNTPARVTRIHKRRRSDRKMSIRCATSSSDCPSSIGKSFCLFTGETNR